MSWAAEEFSGADLGDARLDKRLVRIVETFADKPTASIPEACGDWGATQAAYRFFNQALNEARPLEWQQILNPHRDATIERMRQYPLVLCLQDTTELNFNGQQIRGLGPLSYESQRGMYLHPTYVVTPNHVPLGCLDAWMWSREFKDSEGNRPGMNESLRWEEGYERVAELAQQMPETRLVYVADREADIVSLMNKADEQGCPADWLIRSKHNRALEQGKKLWSSVKKETPMGEIEFELPPRQNQPGRKVRQQVWAAERAISNGKKGKLTVTCVIAKEIDPPPGVQPLEWRLLTNRKVKNLIEATEIVEWYRCRWAIEEFFNVLKNGCQVEALQLEDRLKLELALSVYMVVAWRLAHLQRMGRIHPDLPANILLSEEEWKAAYILGKKKPPEKVPPLGEVIRQIAKLGGFLGRKHDGQPGLKTLWKGYMRVREFVEGLRNLRELGISP